MMGHLNSFSASGGGNLNKNFPKIQMPRGLPGGGGRVDVEASRRFDYDFFKLIPEKSCEFSRLSKFLRLS